MPPTHDLRGGKASVDSFAISSSDFVASIKRCFVSTKSRELADVMLV